jgi:uncharacterized membrane protein YuzA (DUF378 family)
MQFIEHAKKKLYALAIVLLVIGGINWGIYAATGKDVITRLFGKGTMITNAILIIVAVAAIAVALYRDSYLPFLGPTVIPCAVMAPRVPEGADAEVTVHVAPHAKVVYWAAESGSDAGKTPFEAYGAYENAGVAIADDTGAAVLHVRRPISYRVPVAGELAPHVHYRVCEPTGFAGAVRTIRFDGYESFQGTGDTDRIRCHDAADIYELRERDPAAELAAIAADTLQRAPAASAGL